MTRAKSTVAVPLIKKKQAKDLLETIQYNTIQHNTTGARWCRGMFGALQLEGCGFESTSKPRRDPGQVLHSQLLMRFGVKLRFSVRAVVGSASEWEIL